MAPASATAAALPPELAGAEVIHTPCSTIHLTPGHAFKIKKPVNLGYLDFTSLAARKHACEEELRLNTDLAPGVYQALLAIVRLPDGSAAFALPAAIPPGAEVVDYALRMRRLPDAGMLSAILSERDPTASELDAIAAALAAFHARAPRGHLVCRHGAPAAVRDEVLTNLDQLDAALTPLSETRAFLPPALLARLRSFMHDQLARWAPLLARRSTPAPPGMPRIVDGHGDLHAGNICLDPAAVSPANPIGLVIYDRLEFREDFRCKDVAAEIACLAFSLDAAGHAPAADHLVARYAALAADPDLLPLQPLYRAHYAAVRAKVHAMRAGQLVVSPNRPGEAVPERSREADEAVRFAHLAVAYALPPCLILTCGLPGSGKSVAARALRPPLRAAVHRADEIRKQLAGLSAQQRGGPALYTPEMSARTYAEVLARSRADLSAGRSPIADATFRSRSLRAPFIAAARELALPVVIVHCRADEAETRRRLEARVAADADASDADYAVFEAMRTAFEPPQVDEAPAVDLTPGSPLFALVAGVLLSAASQSAAPADSADSATP